MRTNIVGAAACASYDEVEAKTALLALLKAIGIDRSDITGRRVCVKPNLVMAKKPEFAATTHPVLLTALAKILVDWGAASVVVADSCGGPYNSASMRGVYHTCGLDVLRDIPGVTLNENFSFVGVTCPGRRLHGCNILSPVASCEICVDFCKLKTHGLTGLSAATKNLFGIIPGVEKFSLHAANPRLDDFSAMLVDLNEMLYSRCRVIALCDGIVGMEGDGPTHGTPVAAGILLASESTYALDVAAERFIGCETPVLYLDEAASRGLVEREYDRLDIRYVTKPAEKVRFVSPAASSNRFLKGLSGIAGGRFAEFFAAKPRIDRKKCVGCGVCARSCPAHTIEMREKNGRKMAHIQKKACIRCYCCQELCPIGAVEIHENPIIGHIH